MNILKKLFGSKPKKAVPVVCDSEQNSEFIKNEKSEAVKQYFRKGLFNKFVSVLVTVCFIISIANLPAFSADNSRKAKQEKKEKIMEMKDGKTDTSELGLVGAKEAMRSGAGEGVNTMQAIGNMSEEEVDSIIEIDRTAGVLRDKTKPKGKDIVAVYNPEKDEVLGYAGQTDIVYYQALVNRKKSFEKDRINSKGKDKEIGKIDTIGEGQREEIRNEISAEDISKAKGTVIGEYKGNEEKPEIEQETGITKIEEENKEGITVKEPEDKEDNVLIDNQINTNESNSYNVATDTLGSALNSSINPGMAVANLAFNITNEINGTSQEKVNNSDTTTFEGNENSFNRTLMGMGDLPLDNTEQEVVAPVAEVEEIKTEQEELNVTETYGENAREIFDILSEQTGLSDEEINNELQKAGVTKSKFEQVAATLLSILKNGAKVINCAVDSLYNILKGAVTQGILAIQLLATDIANGIFLQNNNADSNQIMTSAYAIKQVQKAYGIESDGYEINFEDFIEALQPGEKAIVWVNGNHYITVTKEQDGSFSVTDINVNNGNPVNYSAAEFTKLMNNKTAVGKDVQTGKQITSMGYKAIDKNGKVTVLTDSKTVAQKGEKISDEKLKSIAGAEYVTIEYEYEVTVKYTVKEKRTYTDKEGKTQEYYVDVVKEKKVKKKGKKTVWKPDNKSKEQLKKELIAQEKARQEAKNKEIERRAAENNKKTYNDVARNCRQSDKKTFQDLASAEDTKAKNFARELEPLKQKYQDAMNEIELSPAERYMQAIEDEKNGIATQEQLDFLNEINTQLEKGVYVMDDGHGGTVAFSKNTITDGVINITQTDANNKVVMRATFNTNNGDMIRDDYHEDGSRTHTARTGNTTTVTEFDKNNTKTGSTKTVVEDDGTIKVTNYDKDNKVTGYSETTADGKTTEYTDESKQTTVKEYYTDDDGVTHTTNYENGQPVSWSDSYVDDGGITHVTEYYDADRTQPKSEYTYDDNPNVHLTETQYDKETGNITSQTERDSAGNVVNEYHYDPQTGEMTSSKEQSGTLDLDKDGTPDVILYNTTDYTDPNHPEGVTTQTSEVSKQSEGKFTVDSAATDTTRKNYDENNPDSSPWKDAVVYKDDKGNQYIVVDGDVTKVPKKSGNSGENDLNAGASEAKAKLSSKQNGGKPQAYTNEEGETCYIGYDSQSGNFIRYTPHDGNDTKNDRFDTVTVDTIDSSGNTVDSYTLVRPAKDGDMGDDLVEFFEHGKPITFTSKRVNMSTNKTGSGTIVATSVTMTNNTEKGVVVVSGLNSETNQYDNDIFMYGQGDDGKSSATQTVSTDKPMNANDINVAESQKYQEAGVDNAIVFNNGVLISSIDVVNLDDYKVDGEVNIGQIVSDIAKAHSLDSHLGVSDDNKTVFINSEGRQNTLDFVRNNYEQIKDGFDRGNKDYGCETIDGKETVVFYTKNFTDKSNNNCKYIKYSDLVDFEEKYGYHSFADIDQAAADSHTDITFTRDGNGNYALNGDYIKGGSITLDDLKGAGVSSIANFITCAYVGVYNSNQGGEPSGYTIGIDDNNVLRLYNGNDEAMSAITWYINRGLTLSYEKVGDFDNRYEWKVSGGQIAEGAKISLSDFDKFGLHKCYDDIAAQGLIIVPQGSYASTANDAFTLKGENIDGEMSWDSVVNSDGTMKADFKAAYSAIRGSGIKMSLTASGICLTGDNINGTIMLSDVVSNNNGKINVEQLQVLVALTDAGYKVEKGEDGSVFVKLGNNGWHVTLDQITPEILNAAIKLSDQDFDVRVENGNVYFMFDKDGDGVKDKCTGKDIEDLLIDHGFDIEDDDFKYAKDNPNEWQKIETENGTAYLMYNSTTGEYESYFLVPTGKNNEYVCAHNTYSSEKELKSSYHSKGTTSGNFDEIFNGQAGESTFTCGGMSITKDSSAANGKGTTIVTSTFKIGYVKADDGYRAKYNISQNILDVETGTITDSANLTATMNTANPYIIPSLTQNPNNGVLANATISGTVTTSDGVKHQISGQQAYISRDNITEYMNVASNDGYLNYYQRTTYNEAVMDDLTETYRDLYGECTQIPENTLDANYNGKNLGSMFMFSTNSWSWIADQYVTGNVTVLNTSGKVEFVTDDHGTYNDIRITTKHKTDDSLASTHCEIGEEDNPRQVYDVSYNRSDGSANTTSYKSEGKNIGQKMAGTRSTNGSVTITTMTYLYSGKLQLPSTITIMHGKETVRLANGEENATDILSGTVRFEYDDHGQVTREQYINYVEERTEIINGEEVKVKTVKNGIIDTIYHEGSQADDEGYRATTTENRDINIDTYYDGKKVSSEHVKDSVTYYEHEKDPTKTKQVHGATETTTKIYNDKGKVESIKTSRESAYTSYTQSFACPFIIDAGSDKPRAIVCAVTTETKHNVVVTTVDSEGKTKVENYANYHRTTTSYTNGDSDYIEYANGQEVSNSKEDKAQGKQPSSVVNRANVNITGRGLLRNTQITKEFLSVGKSLADAQWKIFWQVTAGVVVAVGTAAAVILSPFTGGTSLTIAFALVDLYFAMDAAGHLYDTAQDYQKGYAAMGDVAFAAVILAVTLLPSIGKISKAVSIAKEAKELGMSVSLAFKLQRLGQFENVATALRGLSGAERGAVIGRIGELSTEQMSRLSEFLGKGRHIEDAIILAKGPVSGGTAVGNSIKWYQKFGFYKFYKGVGSGQVWTNVGSQLKEFAFSNHLIGASESIMGLVKFQAIGGTLTKHVLMPIDDILSGQLGEDNILSKGLGVLMDGLGRQNIGTKENPVYVAKSIEDMTAEETVGGSMVTGIMFYVSFGIIGSVVKGVMGAGEAVIDAEAGITRGAGEGTAESAASKAETKPETAESAKPEIETDIETPGEVSSPVAEKPATPIPETPIQPSNVVAQETVAKEIGVKDVWSFVKDPMGEIFNSYVLTAGMFGLVHDFLPEEYRFSLKIGDFETGLDLSAIAIITFMMLLSRGRVGYVENDTNQIKEVSENALEKAEQYSIDETMSKTTVEEIEKSYSGIKNIEFAEGKKGLTIETNTGEIIDVEDTAQLRSTLVSIDINIELSTIDGYRELGLDVKTIRSELDRVTEGEGLSVNSVEKALTCFETSSFRENIVDAVTKGSEDAVNNLNRMYDNVDKVFDIDVPEKVRIDVLDKMVKFGEFTKIKENGKTVYKFNNEFDIDKLCEISEGDFKNLDDMISVIELCSVSELEKLGLNEAFSNELIEEKIPETYSEKGEEGKFSEKRKTSLLKSLNSGNSDGFNNLQRIIKLSSLSESLSEFFDPLKIVEKIDIKTENTDGTESMTIDKRAELLSDLVDTVNLSKMLGERALAKNLLEIVDKVDIDMNELVEKMKGDVDFNDFCFNKLQEKIRTAKELGVDNEKLNEIDSRIESQTIEAKKNEIEPIIDNFNKKEAFDNKKTWEFDKEIENKEGESEEFKGKKAEKLGEELGFKYEEGDTIVKNGNKFTINDKLEMVQYELKDSAGETKSTKIYFEIDGELLKVDLTDMDNLNLLSEILIDRGVDLSASEMFTNTIRPFFDSLKTAAEKNLFTKSSVLYDEADYYNRIEELESEIELIDQEIRNLPRKYGVDLLNEQVSEEVSEQIKKEIKELQDQRAKLEAEKTNIEDFDEIKEIVKNPFMRTLYSFYESFETRTKKIEVNGKEGRILIDKGDIKVIVQSNGQGERILVDQNGNEVQVKENKEGKTVLVDEKGKEIIDINDEIQEYIDFGIRKQIASCLNSGGKFGLTKAQMDVVDTMKDNLQGKSINADEFAKKIYQLGTGAGKSSIVAMIFPCVDMINIVNGERTIILADTETNVGNLINRINGLYGNDYSLSLVNHNTIANAAGTDILCMTYQSLSFSVLSGELGAKGEGAKYDIGVVIGDEVDKCIFDSRTVMSKSGGFENIGSAGYNFIAYTYADVVKSAEKITKTMMEKDSILRDLVEQRAELDNINLENNGKIDIEKLKDFGIDIKTIDKYIGETIRDIENDSNLSQEGKEHYRKQLTELRTGLNEINFEEGKGLDFVKDLLDKEIQTRRNVLISQSPEVYDQIMFKEAENIIKNLDPSVRNAARNFFAEKGYTDLKEVAKNSIHAKLTYQEGLEYGVVDGEVKIMANGVYGDLVPRAGIKQILEYEAMLKGDIGYDKMTAFSDKDAKGNEVIQSVHKARGIIGLTGTVSPLAADVMDMELQTFSSTNIEYKGEEGTMLFEKEGGYLNTDASVYRTSVGAFGELLAKFCKGDIVYAAMSQADIDLLCKFGELIDFETEIKDGKEVYKYTGVEVKKDFITDNALMFDAALNPNEGAALADNKAGKHMLIGTPEQAGRGLDLTVDEYFENLKDTGYYKNSNVENIEQNVEFDLFMLDQQLSYKSALEQLFGRVGGTRFANMVENIHLKFLGTLSTIRATYDEKYEGKYSAKIDEGTFDGKDLTNLVYDRVLDELGKPAERKIIQQSTSRVNQLTLTENADRTMVDYERFKQEMQNKGYADREINDITNTLITRGFLIQGTNQLLNSNQNVNVMTTEGKVFSGYALQLLNADDDVVKIISEITGVKIAKDDNGNYKLNDVIEAITKLQDIGMLATTSSNRNSLQEILMISKLTGLTNEEFEEQTSRKDSPLSEMRDVAIDIEKANERNFEFAGNRVIENSPLGEIKEGAIDTANTQASELPTIYKLQQMLDSYNENGIGGLLRTMEDNGIKVEDKSLLKDLEKIASRTERYNEFMQNEDNMKLLNAERFSEIKRNWDNKEGIVDVLGVLLDGVKYLGSLLTSDDKIEVAKTILGLGHFSILKVLNNRNIDNLKIESANKYAESDNKEKDYIYLLLATAQDNKDKKTGKDNPNWDGKYRFGTEEEIVEFEEIFNDEDKESWNTDIVTKIETLPVVAPLIKKIPGITVKKDFVYDDYVKAEAQEMVAKREIVEILFPDIPNTNIATQMISTEQVKQIVSNNDWKKGVAPEDVKKVQQLKEQLDASKKYLEDTGHKNSNLYKKSNVETAVSTIDDFFVKAKQANNNIEISQENKKEIKEKLKEKGLYVNGKLTSNGKILLTQALFALVNNNVNNDINGMLKILGKDSVKIGGNVDFTKLVIAFADLQQEGLLLSLDGGISIEELLYLMLAYGIDNRADMEKIVKDYKTNGLTENEYGEAGSIRMFKENVTINGRSLQLEMLLAKRIELQQQKAKLESEQQESSDNIIKVLWKGRQIKSIDKQIENLNIEAFKNYESYGYNKETLEREENKVLQVSDSKIIFKTTSVNELNKELVLSEAKDIMKDIDENTKDEDKKIDAKVSKIAELIFNNTDYESDLTKVLLDTIPDDKKADVLETLKNKISEYEKDSDIKKLEEQIETNSDELFAERKKLNSSRAELRNNREMLDLINRIEVVQEQLNNLKTASASQQIKDTMNKDELETELKDLTNKLKEKFENGKYSREVRLVKQNMNLNDVKSLTRTVRKQIEKTNLKIEKEIADMENEVSKLEKDVKDAKDKRDSQNRDQQIKYQKIIVANNVIDSIAIDVIEQDVNNNLEGDVNNILKEDEKIAKKLAKTLADLEKNKNAVQKELDAINSSSLQMRDSLKHRVVKLENKLSEFENRKDIAQALAEVVLYLEKATGEGYKDNEAVVEKIYEKIDNILEDRIASKAIVGVMKPQEVSVALKALFAIFDNPDDIAKMFGYDNIDKVRGASKSDIANTYLTMAGRTKTKAELELLDIARDVMFMVCSGDGNVVKAVRDAKVDELTDKLIRSKAANMNYVIKEITKQDKNGDFVIDLTKIKEVVENPDLDLGMTSKELLEKLASAFDSGNRKSNEKMKNTLMELSNIHAIQAAA